MAKTGSRHTDKTDIQLIEEALRGDSQLAYNILYVRYNDRVTSCVKRYITDPSDIEDISQETFSKAFRQLRSFDKEKSFSNWIYTIAKNSALDFLSAQQSRGRGMKVDMTDEEQENISGVVDASPNPEEEVIRGQDTEMFLHCIESLPDLYRDIMVMLHEDHLGYNEIAAKTDLPLNTVKTRIRRAKEMITKMIQEEENSGPAPSTGGRSPQ